MRDRLTHPALRVAVLAVALAATLVPLLRLALDSFKQTGDFYGGGFLPHAWTTDNYREVFGGSVGAVAGLLNSLVVAALTTAIAVTIGTAAAYGLARLPYAWVGVVTYGILVIRFYPKITTILPYYVMMRAAGLLDSLIAVVIAHVSITVPFVVLLMMTFFREIPRSLEEAAMVDGCTAWQAFRRVVLPLVRPALATCAILTAMFSWNEFLIAASVTSRRAATLPVLVAGFLTDKGIQLGQLSALSVVIIVPVAAFILLTQRHLVRGLTMGAVKG